MNIRTVVVAVLVLALLGAGGLLIRQGLAEQPPEATPTPEAEFEISDEEARELALTPESAVDEPIEFPDEDLGPFVRTDPVPVPDRGVVAGSGGQWANRLQIPMIRVDAGIVDQGVTPQNTMSLPEDLSRVGRLDTTRPLTAGEGVTLLAGHVTWQGDHGALYYLGSVRPGATVDTWDADGQRTTWAVTSVRLYNKQALPDSLFEADGQRRLVIVTCGGPIIQLPDGRWTHEDNIVVTAVPVDVGVSAAVP